MMSKRCFLAFLASILALTTLATPTAVSADVLSMRLEAHTGPAGGEGVSGDRKDEAFHAGASGLSYGAIVGLEVLWIDVWVEHNQYQDSDGLAGTWTQFMTGLDYRFDLGEKTRGGSHDADGKLTGDDRYSPLFAELGVGVGFGVGTGQQIDPPLDNSEVSDKGFLLQGHVALGYRLSRLISLGLVVPVQGAFMFKNDDGSAANDLSTQYRSLQYAALLNFRVNLQIR